MDLAVFVLGIDVEHLAALERLADGDDQPPAGLQLAEQLRRGVLGHTGDDDDVIQKRSNQLVRSLSLRRCRLYSPGSETLIVALAAKSEVVSFSISS